MGSETARGGPVTGDRFLSGVNYSPRREVYSVGYGADARRRHERRTASEQAGFFLPYLRPGMRLLDCGCGPGSITLGLAKAVAPGQTIGIDVEPRQIYLARGLAAESEVPNASFAVANVYDLPFSDASFDAVFAHTLIEHLRQPLQVLRELRHILRPGGVAGIRDPDYGIGIWAPPTPLLEAASKLLLRIREHHGGSPYYARHQRRLLGEAGFARVQAFAFAECQGSVEATRAFAEVIAEVLHDPATIIVAIEHGWADRGTIEAMTAEVRAWGKRPDAFRVLLECAAVGWVDDHPRKT